MGWAWLLGVLLGAGVATGQPASKGGATGQPAPKGGAPGPGAPAPSATASNPLDNKAQARALYEKGRALADKNEWEAAYAEFRAAYAWYNFWQIAFGLGNAAFRLGKWPEAVEMLAQYLQEATDLPDAERAEVQQRLAQAKSKCGLIRVEGPAGAELKVDGTAAGKLPEKRELYVLPGSHVIEIITPAGTKKMTLEVAAGQEAKAIGDDPSASPTATTGPTATPIPSGAPGPTEPDRTGPNLTPVYALGAAAGVALLTGLGVFIGSEVKGAEAITARDAYLALSPQRQADMNEKNKVHNLLVEQDNLITGAVVAWITAAALGGGAAGYFLYQRGSSKETRPSKAPGATVRWLPVASPTSAGLVFHGSF